MSIMNQRMFHISQGETKTGIVDDSTRKCGHLVGTFPETID